MALSIGDAILKLGVDSSELDAGMQKAISGIKDQMKAVGATLTGMGLAVTGALTMAVMSAAKEEVNVQRLAVTLKNLGVSYDDVKDSLESVIIATQRKTGIADDQQRDVLNRLLLVTNDYEKALALMPTALDLAAAGGMDAATAATYLGKAMLELEDGAEKVTVRFGQASLQFKSMEDIQKRVAGAAKATANPFAVLKAEMGDIVEQIGSYLLPIFKELVQRLFPIIDNIKKWAAEHPNLVKQLIILAGVVGGFAMVLGPILIMLPTLITAFTLLSGPIGLIVLAIMALVTAGTLLILNWETIKEKTTEIWESITGFLKQVWDNITGVFKENWDLILAILFPAVGLPMLIAKNWGTITDIVKGIWDNVIKWIRSGWENVVSFVSSGIDWLIGQVNKAISLINKVPGVEIGTLSPVSQSALPGMQHGGMIVEPTLLTSLRTMRPYAVAGEAGPEPVGWGNYRTANIYLQLDGRTIARVIGQPLVDEIRLKQGLKI